MKFRLAGIANDSIVDGPGLRLAVFMQGCPHACPGCHNPETHDFSGGREADTEEIIELMRENILLDGVTLTGGEPFCQPEAARDIALAARRLGLNVWAYTGYDFEELLHTPEKLKLLECVDVLVDGKFELSMRSLDLNFKGSKNQRTIDVPESLKTGKVTLIE